MSENVYAKCECAGCHRIVPKDEALLARWLLGGAVALLPRLSADQEKF
jgi:hypothetical protein